MKKIFIFIMMLSVLILASCNGGDNPSNTNGKTNTASVKEAATELANEIDKVGSPLDVIGYDMSNIKTELKSYTMMSYNSDGSDTTTDEDGWEDYPVPESEEQTANVQFEEKMAPFLQEQYERAISTKNRILKAKNEYMYIWNTQADGSKTRVVYEGNKLILEQYDYNNGIKKEYSKVYVEKDNENKLLFEILIIKQDQSYIYCNYYENKNYDFAYLETDFSKKPEIFSIDLTNEYPVMIRYINQINIELVYDTIQFSVDIGQDSTRYNERIILKDYFKMYITQNLLSIEFNDKVGESIRVKKSKSNPYNFDNILFKFKNGEEIYNNINDFNSYSYINPEIVNIKINLNSDIEQILKKYGYLEETDTFDLNILKPNILNKNFDNLTHEYIYSELSKRIPEIKDYSTYCTDLENAEELKKPFEMEVKTELNGKAKINENSIDLSNVTLKVTGVDFKNLDYKFNMELITGFRIYYKGKLIKTVKNVVTNGVATMENPGIIEFDEEIQKYLNKDEIKELPDSIRIEVYGIGTSYNIEIE